MLITQSNISAWGNSRAVRIPKNLLEIIGLSDNDKVDVIVEPETKSITIKAAIPKYNSLEDLFKGYDGDYQCTEYDFGEDVGHERVW